MLDRVKKNLILAFTGMCLALPVFALDSTVSYININDRAYQDVEIVLTDKSEILLPFKQVADLFKIQYSANRIDKHISFKTFDGKNGMITVQGVFIDDAPISKRKVEFLTQGIMDGVFNEAYITPDVASIIMGAKFETNKEDLSVSVIVDRDIPILQNANPINDDNKPKAYQDVIAPRKPGKITLNKIGLRSNMMTNNMDVKGSGYRNTSNTFSGSTQATLNGNIWGGKYRVEANEYHYKNDAFMFGGLTAAYQNTIKNKEGKDKLWYELGKVQGRTDIDASVGTNIMGAQIWNYDYDKVAPSDINGYVKPTSLVRLTVNNLEPVMLSTYAGYYSLRDVQLPNPVTSIKLEEVNEDGTVELIKEERYSLYGDKPFQKEHRASAYAGVWGYQNRFFRDGADIYRGNNKKVTVGADYQYGIKDNLTFESRITGDKIYQKNNAHSVYRIPTNDTLLVSGTQKSVNYLEGATSLNSVEWVNPKNQNIKLRATAGGSVAHDIREEHTHAGYIGKLAGSYDKDISKYKKGILEPKKVGGRLELFQTSPDFYIASSDTTSKNDRTGGRASANVSFNSTNVSGSYSRYYSNINHRYRGGAIRFDEATGMVSTKVPKVATVRVGGNYRRGENDFGRNKNYFYDANISRNIKNWATVQAGRRQSLYDTEYDHPTTFERNYYSRYTDDYAKLTVPIPGNHGRFSMGHSMVEYKSASYKNSYNMFRFGYTFPEWKRMMLGLGYGFRYSGQGGNDFNVNLGYRAKSGQVINVGYQYSENGGFFIDNMFMPTTSRHSINFVFNDAFQLFHNGLKSVGDEDLDKGLFEAIAFVDVNNNGKYDKKIDVPVQDVSLLTSWSSEINITNKKGRVCSPSLDQGVYNVAIDMNTLPITVAPSTNDLISRKVKISGGQTTMLEIPLVSTVGSVSGKLHISDDFQRDLRISDFVVVLLDDNGKEVNYSTVDSTGEFYISGLAPGRYTLKLDQNFINAYGLETLQNSEIKVFIPYDYMTPIDITNQNLEYKTLAL